MRSVVSGFEVNSLRTKRDAQLDTNIQIFFNSFII